MELCDPLFTLSADFAEMQTRYKRMLRKDEKWQKEHERIMRSGMTWMPHYVKIIQQCNRRGNYRCW